MANKWEVSIIELKKNGRKKYKATRRMPVTCESSLSLAQVNVSCRNKSIQLKRKSHEAVG